MNKFLTIFTAAVLVVPVVIVVVQERTRGNPPDVWTGAAPVYRTEPVITQDQRDAEMRAKMGGGTLTQTERIAYGAKVMSVCEAQLAKAPSLSKAGNHNYCLCYSASIAAQVQTADIVYYNRAGDLSPKQKTEHSAASLSCARATQ